MPDPTEEIANSFGTAIRVGQVWEDLCAVGRTVRVTAIDAGGAPHAVLDVVTNAPGTRGPRPRNVQIHVDRLQPSSTGYRLVTEQEIDR